MEWNLDEALAYYQGQGAPASQSALVNLLKEVQEESGGSLPLCTVSAIAQAYQLKESYLLAIIKRIPALHLENTHLLELCGGKTCAKRARLASFVEKTYGKKPEKFTVKYTGCMRMCRTGPNIRWDGELYEKADEALIRRLIERDT